ncbi:hypothetical protein DOTSEDRAFT_73392 [Dothistroma septosporum NZE10]|uniref:Major facilitator superfamily (MFS) profile domain-containing protein n=1 Tax=Dothistroma septosporum (strain NZE10 / CBS 128990) TaxID=675120 RepID=N1PJE2_DOTSN|nr:hypothetical protein DOTSEDRAFT_73392 [Dothistroma septosporum NZE10]
MAHVKSGDHALRTSTAFTTFVVCFAIHTDSFLYAAIVPVAPFALAKQVHEEKVQVWVAILLGSFGIGCFVTSVPWGYFIDRSTSRRCPFLIGLLVLLASTGLLWVAPYIKSGGLPVQVIARVLQGFASTIVWMTGLAILVDVVGPARIGEYSGYIGLALNLGNLTGPLLGGVVFARSGYHAVFALIISVVLVDIMLRLIVKEKPVQKTVRPTRSYASVSRPLKSRVRGPGIARDIEKVAPVENALEVALHDPVSSPQDSLSLSTSTCPSEVSRLPVMLRLLLSTRFAVAVWGIFVLAVVYTGFETVLPLTVKKVFGWNAEGGGLAFVPLSLPSLFGPLVGKFTDRHGGRWITAGAFVTICPTLILLRLINENNMKHKVLLCALLVIIGICLTLTLEPLFAEITGRATRLEAVDAGALGGTTVGRGYYVLAYAHFNWAWSLGNTLGPILSGFIVDAAGWKTAMLAMGVLAGTSAIPIFLWIDGWVCKTAPPSNASDDDTRIR